MKIEGTSPNLESVATPQTGRVGTGRAKDAQQGPAAQVTDRVQVSEDAALADAARLAAEAAPNIRQDLVEQMRAKLSAGEIGNDAERLADRLIDHLLES
ncbi:MAG: flagellar biosynthesis anti-sigma factor FlgM [Acidobacteria bacterium]|nr:flagellar biosynthesis anti-sigma factor FlgM [Acidobacteriota bacterium]